MQTLHFDGLRQILGQKRTTKSVVEQIFSNFNKSNFGIHDNSDIKPTGYDTFSITENISELLSPACGMTEEEKEAYLAKIIAKLKSGKKLTPEEMRFLQAENPTLYQQIARVQSMRDSLETRLKNSTSKENAQTIYTDAMSIVSDKDPMKEYIVAAYDDVMKEFKNSDKYLSLPSTEKEAREK